MGVVAPRDGFNARLAELAHGHGALLIVDEVMTGFRVHRGGWAGLEPVDADLFTFGKVMGGGLPAAAFGGRAEIMAPARPGRPGLPGRHAVRKPAGLRGRSRLAAAGHRRRLRAARRARQDGRRAGRRRAACGRGSALPVVRRKHVLGLLHRRCGHRLRRRQAPERRGVQGVLPRHARARRLPAAERLRGVVRLDGDRRRGTGDASRRRCRTRLGRRPRVWRDHDEDGRARAAPRRGLQPGEGPVRADARLPTLRARRADGQGGRAGGRRARHHLRRGQPARARTADRRADRRPVQAADRGRRAAHRERERLRGATGRGRRRRVARPAQLVEDPQPGDAVVGRALHADRDADVRRAARRPGGRRGPRGPVRVAPAADLDAAPARRAQAALARSAQARVRPGQPDHVPLRGRAHRRHRLQRAGRPPRRHFPGAKTAKGA